MPVTSVGDMAQQFISMRNGSAIKTEISRLAESLSTGQVSDITESLGGQTTQLSGINHSLSQLDAFGQAAIEAQLTLSNIQTSLDQLDGLRAETSESLLLLSNSSTGINVDEAATAARSTFERMVATLNTSLSDRSLFGGVAVERVPLAAADDMLADIQASVGGATDQATISAAIDFWFDDPAGGFATMGYLGDTGALMQKRVSENTSYAIDVRADDPAIKEVLKGAAFAAMAADLPALDPGVKSGLLEVAGTTLFAASGGLVGIQARIGYVEAGVERTMAENAAQKTTLSLLKNDLTLADSFDTASRLQSVQLQLETHYSVIARLSQISLVGYI